MTQFDSNGYNSLADRLEKSARVLRTGKTRNLNKGFIQDLVNAINIIKSMARSAAHLSGGEVRFVDDEDDEPKPANVLSKRDSKRLTKEARGVGFFSVLAILFLAIFLVMAI